jgi:hypothetical protein
VSSEGVFAFCIAEIDSCDAVEPTGPISSHTNDGVQLFLKVLLFLPKKYDFVPKHYVHHIAIHEVDWSNFIWTETIPSP